MKKWNTPAIAEVKLSETANGCLPGHVEREPLTINSCDPVLWLFGSDDSLAGKCGGYNDKNENKDVVDQNS